MAFKKKLLLLNQRRIITKKNKVYNNTNDITYVIFKQLIQFAFLNTQVIKTTNVSNYPKTFSLKQKSKVDRLLVLTTFMFKIFMFQTIQQPSIATTSSFTYIRSNFLEV
jgi:hypothetical protein